MALITVAEIEYPGHVTSTNLDNHVQLNVSYKTPKQTREFIVLLAPEEALQLKVIFDAPEFTRYIRMLERQRSHPDSKPSHFPGQS